MPEKWLPVVGAETSYEVSDFGRVKSVDRVICDMFRGTERVRRFKGVVLRPRKKDSGHLVVTLTDRKQRFVHVLVLEAFIGPCPPGKESRHLNGVPGDNVLSNLCWGTLTRNRQDRKYHKVTGRHQSRLSPSNVLWVRAVYGTVPVIKLAAELGVSRQAIWRARTGKAHADV